MLPQFLLCPLSLRFHFFLLAVLLLPLPGPTLVGDYLEEMVESSPHSLVNPAPILSVDVPLAAHRLRAGMIDGHAHDVLHSHLYAPHLHRTFEFHLEPNSPLWSVTRIYLQNQRLKTILDLASSLSSIGRRCNTLHTIQREVKEDLFSTFYQMQMPEFANNLE